MDEEMDAVRRSVVRCFELLGNKITLKKEVKDKISLNFMIN